ncbi:39S ribosomal protein L1, mitochondrial [Oryzias melastigma]|uniref:Large ribosomal subunit protein uL1m n=1 Tax=Oryzias melastigma TaxID=30732 RepID=A0A3B3BVP1_ORYME|nr:39S ribosomal protein L1, mitochondrial [Oryzias melastigma]XP_024119309.1 39S ribosomal protein L1, mitochondrial [Oryzias melastigma]KAF6733656.1 39S ribosomal protein L1, mitochondrial [Oryzias melastigma]
MAALRIALRKVTTACTGQLMNTSAPVCTGGSQSAARKLPVRTFAAVKAVKKDKKGDVEEVKKEKRVMDDRDRHKPFGKTAWVPVDDVFILKYYPRTVYRAVDAIQMLKRFQVLDLTPHNQPLYIDLKLDMKLEKKKKIDPFVSTVHLPHPFKTAMNRVLVFTEDLIQAREARENGAITAGGVELIQQVLDDQISADFYLAVPEILPKLLPLKNKLRKKFPKSKRGTVSTNIPKTLELFKTGHEYLVESDCYVRTQIATLDMPSEQIFANLQTILMDVCSHRPASAGPFIERAIMASHTSEAVWVHYQDALPNTGQEGGK